MLLGDILLVETGEQNFLIKMLFIFLWWPPTGGRGSRPAVIKEQCGQQVFAEMFASLRGAMEGEKKEERSHIVLFSGAQKGSRPYGDW